MLLSVIGCFILLYRQVIVSFFASVKTRISIQLVAIVDRISIYVLRSLSGLPHELFQIMVLKGQYRLSLELTTES